MNSSFKNKYTFEKRYQESKKVLDKYSERIPIIVEKLNDSELPDIDKCKYLVPKEMSISQFMFVIRKRIKLLPSQTLFFTINGKMISSSQLLLEIYDNEKDKDGFLYITYTNECVHLFCITLTFLYNHGMVSLYLHHNNNLSILLQYKLHMYTNELIK